MNIIEKLGITPGPWGAMHRPNGDYDEYKNQMFSTQIFKKDSPEYVIADIHWCPVDIPYGEKSARQENSTLIAAAPEMLEALIDATIEIINTEQNEYKWSKEDVIRRNHGYISVIEKATGKTWEEIKELLKEVDDE